MKGKKKTMTRDDIKTEILETLSENAPTIHATAAVNRIMKKVDEYVESRVIEARLEVMKNFKAI